MRIALFLLIAVPAVALAQPADDSRRGDVALVVALTDVSLVNLSPRLSGVGLRYGITDRTLIGGTLGLSAGTSDGDATFDGLEVTTVLWTESHVGPRGRRVSPFVGGQVLARVSDRSGTSPACSTCGPDQVVEFEEESSDLSVGAIGGAELMVLRGLSVSAAAWLGVGLHRQSSVRTAPGLPPEEFEQRSVNVGTGGTALRLSLYF